MTTKNAAHLSRHRARRRSIFRSISTTFLLIFPRQLKCCVGRIAACGRRRNDNT